MISLLLTYLGISLLINILVFFLAYYFKSDKFTDITYALTFVVLSLIIIINNPVNLWKIILFLLIFLWAARLGTFLLIRISFFKSDKRFDGIRKSFSKLFAFFLLQAITVFVVLFPSLIFMSNEKVILGYTSILGAFVWLTGFIFEAISDKQKFEFIKIKKNKKDFIKKGLWKYSRHPNYFGEILIWIGIYLFTFPSLYSISSLYAILGLISPLYIYILLRYVSGIPILEKSADKKFKKNKDYKKYKESTPLLIPYKLLKF